MIEIWAVCHLEYIFFLKFDLEFKKSGGERPISELGKYSASKELIILLNIIAVLDTLGMY